MLTQSRKNKGTVKMLQLRQDLADKVGIVTNALHKKFSRGVHTNITARLACNKHLNLNLIKVCMALFELELSVLLP